MTPPVALQLYTVRQELARDFAGTVEKIAAMGYVGVETAGFAGTTPEAAARLFSRLGLAVCAAHAPLPLGEQQSEVLEMMDALGCRRLVAAYVPPSEYQSLDQIRRVCHRFNEANEVALAHGLQFGVHNHWWEFEPVAGTYPYKLWLEWLEPDIFFELDTYWAQTAGMDAAQVVAELGARAPLLHIKDGPAEKEAPMVAAGQGVMDFPAIARAAAGRAEWWIVELDRCATDMLAAVQQSYAYLTTAGLAAGHQGPG